MLFGALTFIIPEVSGIGLGRLIGLDWGGSVLLGSVYASHTLVAFPLLSRLGILRNEAVSVTIGATVFTDVLALLILAIVAGAHGGQNATVEGGELSLTTLIQLVMLMTGYAVIILFGLPRLGKIFFRNFTGRSVEFQFVLVSLFVAAFLADLIGTLGKDGSIDFDAQSLLRFAVAAVMPEIDVCAGTHRQRNARIHGYAIDDDDFSLPERVLGDGPANVDRHVGVRGGEDACRRGEYYQKSNTGGDESMAECAHFCPPRHGRIWRPVLAQAPSREAVRFMHGPHYLALR